MHESEISQRNDNHWMQQALNEANKAAQEGEVPVGAIIVNNNAVIASAYNQCIGQHDATAHAEIKAIREAGKVLGNYRLSDCTLYVTLEPCTMCFGAMVHSRIGRLVYGAQEPKAGVVVSQLQLPEQSLYNHFFTISGGVLAQQCSEMLSDFFAKRRAQIKAARQQLKTGE